MAAIPFLLSLALALVICPAVLRTLRARGWTSPNHAGLALVHPAGVALMITVVACMLALAALDRASGSDTLGVEALGASLFAVGVGLLGLADDLLGDRVAGAPRGLRAHARALREGRVSTGVAKAFGTAALAGVVLGALGFEGRQLLLGASVLTLSCHVFNLLDLRPGRAVKALGVLGGALTLGSLTLAPAATLGALLGPIVVLLVPDLRGRAMLGDSGASAVGAVGGLWIVLALPTLGQVAALVVLAAVALFGELRSISALVERTPALRKLDSLGRSHA